MDKPFQRKGGKSNTEVGNRFEDKIKSFFAGQGIDLQRKISIKTGINGTKFHDFDLGDLSKKILIECKSHKWTEGGNVPSAKLTVWDQAMYYFYSAPKDYRKIFMELKDYSSKKHETLAEYYIRTHSHLIPKDVEIWEFDESSNIASKIR